jgi:hypothetical protein
VAGNKTAFIGVAAVVLAAPIKVQRLEDVSPRYASLGFFRFYAKHEQIAEKPRYNTGRTKKRTDARNVVGRDA